MFVLFRVFYLQCIWLILKIAISILVHAFRYLMIKLRAIKNSGSNEIHSRIKCAVDRKMLTVWMKNPLESEMRTLWWYGVTRQYLQKPIKWKCSSITIWRCNFENVEFIEKIDVELHFNSFLKILSISSAFIKLKINSVLKSLKQSNYQFISTMPVSKSKLKFCTSASYGSNML